MKVSSGVVAYTHSTHTDHKSQIHRFYKMVHSIFITRFGLLFNPAAITSAPVVFSHNHPRNEAAVLLPQAHRKASG